MADLYSVYPIISGMYGGFTCPAGSVQSFMETVQPSTSTHTGSVELTNADGNAYQWAGAYGVNGEILKDYWMTNADGQSHEPVIFEIEFPVPEGATYYKQTLAVMVWMLSYFDTETNHIYGTIGIGSALYRREYASPSATPVSTLIQDNTATTRLDYYYGSPTTYNYQVEKVYTGMGKYTNYDGKKGLGFYIYTEGTRLDGQTHPTRKHGTYQITYLDEDQLETYFNTLDPIERNDPYEPPGPKPGPGPGPGGFGPQTDIVDPIPVPDVPPIGACDAGFVTMYHLTTAEMQVFAQDLYDPDAIQAILAMFRNPMDFICGVMLMPFAPVGTHMYYPKFGTYVWHNAYAKVEEEYKVIDCGTIAIPHYYNTCFDYSPYYRIKLWLPYIGYREIDTDEVMGSTLNVVYHIDVLTGNCVAFVNKPNVGIYGPQIPKVIAQFDGNVGVKIPVTSTSYDQMIGACVNLIGRIATVGAAVAGGVGGYMASEVAMQQIGSQIMGSTTDAVNSNKVSAQRSGNCSGISGFMAIQKPHVLIELPWQDLPANYQELEGFPSNKGGTLSQFSGFTAVETIKLQISGALDSEKDEINSILKGGVYI